MLTLNEKKINIILIFSFLLFCSISSSQAFLLNLNDKHISSIHISLTDSFPILVTSNDDFDSLGFPGNGSSSNPYIIENLHIVSTTELGSAIQISGTNVYFVIQNCEIISKYVGIYVQSTVASATAKIINNTITSSTTFGGGIAVGTDYVLIENNTIFGFSQGIHLNYANYCDIKGNKILLSYYQGVNIRYSSYNIIIDNDIRNSNQHGLAIVGSGMYNVIYNNIFVNNSNEPTYDIDGERTGNIVSQGYDEGNNNQWYDSSNQIGNWWDDYDGKGTYEIDGPAGSVDQYPQKYITNESNFISIITLLAIIGIATLIVLKRRYNNKRK